MMVFFATWISLELHNSTIFNRWSEVVFPTNYNSPWNDGLGSGIKSSKGELLLFN